MIHSFVCKHTEKLYNGRRVLRFQAFAQQAEKRLQILEGATCIEDLMNLPPCVRIVVASLPNFCVNLGA
jgi:proteic killer suppression protein